MSDGYAVFFGLATIITSLIATLFLVVTVVAMIRSRLHRDKSAYRIMISQNLSDILQLIPHFFGGCALLFNKELDLTLNLILGHIMYCSWNVMIFLYLLLAFDRFCMLNFTRGEIRPACANAQILFCWILGAITAYLFYFCNHNLIFVVSALCWTTVSQADSTLYDFLYRSQYAELILTFILSCFIVLSAGLKRYKYVKAKRLKNKEQQILAQNVLSFMSTVGNMYAWNYQNSAKNQLLFAAIINLHWVAICGMTPFISFVMNSEIRAAVLSFLGRKPVSNQSVTVVSRFVTPTYG
uniref:G_PROTEIN_RECEP_F1_2 domain-containing protein n=1 Tax=Bursaphelenchus xylophilus TaxID=6326 RepID=A0A1I7SEQ3_BURXY